MFNIGPPSSRITRNLLGDVITCGQHGHIRPYCYKLHGYPQSHVQSRLNRKKIKSKNLCKEQISTCLISKETKSWHQKPSHPNLKSMKKIISGDDIKELPKLKIEEDKIGKQPKMSHKKLQHLATSKDLKPLHLDTDQFEKSRSILGDCIYEGL
jgi:hypothetical protein